MAKIEKILFPVNFQKYSSKIFERVLELKKFNLKEIILLHFIESYKCFRFLTEEFREKIIDDWKKLAEDKLKEYGKLASQNGISVKIEVLEGNPRWEILKIADKYSVDSIITGFQGDAVFEEGYLDANTELILRSCKYPAFVFRGSKNIDPSTGEIYKWDKILFPTDFSDFSMKVMEYLPLFPKGGVKKIEVLHIQDDNLFKHLTPDTISLYNEKDRRRMDSIKTKLKKLGYETIETKILMGIPHKLIVKEIEKDPDTLVIMGSRGKNGSFQMLFGSTTERVTRMSKSPILII